MTTLSNDVMTVVTKAGGAELTSIVAYGREYLWQADPAVWARHAPVLFPIVGRLAGDRHTHRGQSYTLGQHGFARDREFTLVHGSERAVTYELVADSQTRTHYPFDFALTVAYLVDDDGLAVTYGVANTGDEPMPFSIGAHPAFRCPLDPGEAFEDYELAFDRPVTTTRQWLVDGLRTRTTPFLDDAATLPLSAALFADDALVMDNVRARTVMLQHKERGHGVALTTAEPWSYYGVWSKPDAAGKHHFVCLEPWQGVTSKVGEAGELDLKEGIIALPIGARAIFGYRIAVMG